MESKQKLFDMNTGFPVKPESEAIWYRGICNKTEIDRILKPKNGRDLLLQRRADIIADQVRFTRLYTHKSRQEGWNFENSFKTRHYEQFIDNLSEEYQNRCKLISFGDIFSDDLNGFCEKNEYFGTIIYLNESLRYFQYFMFLALYPFDYDIPVSVQVASLRIAIRILLKKEAMDFEMDPRGIVPKELDITIRAYVEEMMQYIAGHEFSHYLCNHLKDSSIRAFFTGYDDKKYESEIFNIDQRQEFEADLKSLELPNYTEEKYRIQFLSALFWFIFLDIGEYASEIINPSIRRIRTHPSANDRIVNIRDNASPPKFEENDKKVIDYLLEYSEYIKKFLEEDMSVSMELYETYGSVYLADPDTKWRGRELVDRVDY